jgi:Ribosomal RNA large subunit methyltransferase D, RlmJ
LWHKVIAAADCRRLSLAKTLRAELTLAPLGDPTGLNGCGLIIVNPPWTLAGELAILLPALAKNPSAVGRGLVSESTGWPAKRPRLGDIVPLSRRTQLVSSSISGSDVPPSLDGGPAE